MSNTIFTKVDESGKPVKESAESNKQFKRRMHQYEAKIKADSKPQTEAKSDAPAIEAETTPSADVERTLTAKQKLAELEAEEKAIADSEAKSDDTPSETPVADVEPVIEATPAIVEPVSDSKPAIEPSAESTPIVETVKPIENEANTESTPVVENPPTVENVDPVKVETPTEATTPIVENAPSTESPVKVDTESDALEPIGDTEAKSDVIAPIAEAIAPVVTPVVATPSKPSAEKLAEAMSNVIPPKSADNPRVDSAEENAKLGENDAPANNASAESTESPKIKNIDLMADSEDMRRLVQKLFVASKSDVTDWLKGKTMLQTPVKFVANGGSPELVLLGSATGKENMLDDLLSDSIDPVLHTYRVAVLRENLAKLVEPKGDSGIAINAIGLIANMSADNRTAIYDRLNVIASGGKSDEISKLSQFNVITPEIAELLRQKAILDKQIYQLMLGEAEKAKTEAKSSDKSENLSFEEKRKRAMQSVTPPRIETPATTESSTESDNSANTEAKSDEEKLSEHKAQAESNPVGL